MVVDARDRQQLRERLEATLGERPAEVLMENLFDEGAAGVADRLGGWCWPPSPLPDRSRLFLRGAYAWEMASRMFSRAALRAGRMAASIPNNPDTSR